MKPETINTIRQTIIDAAGLASVASISFGASQIYAPAGWIVGGALILVGVIQLSRGAKE